jgi:hypothetical protein
MEVKTIVSAANAASTTSVIWEIGDYQDYSVHVDFSGGGGDLAGNLDLGASNNGTDWVDLADQKAVAAAASKMYNKTDQHYKYLKVTWTPSSGTGNWTVMLGLKRKAVTNRGN